MSRICPPFVGLTMILADWTKTWVIVTIDFVTITPMKVLHISRSKLSIIDLDNNYIRRRIALPKHVTGQQKWFQQYDHADTKLDIWFKQHKGRNIWEDQGYNAIYIHSNHMIYFQSTEQTLLSSGHGGFGWLPQLLNSSFTSSIGLLSPGIRIWNFVVGKVLKAKYVQKTENMI